MLNTRAVGVGLGTLIPSAAGVGTPAPGPRKIAIRFAVAWTELIMVAPMVYVSPITSDWLRANWPALVVGRRLLPSKIGGSLKSVMKYRPKIVFFELCCQS